jgi:hypothetical protein
MLIGSLTINFSQHIWEADMADDNRKKSGALLGPFKSLQLAKRHTTQINSDTTSAEEFPWASIYQAPADTPAYVLPATVQQQHCMLKRQFIFTRALTGLLYNKLRVAL